MKTVLLTIVSLSFCSCGFTVGPDGSKSFTVDREAGYKALEIIATK